MRSKNKRRYAQAELEGLGLRIFCKMKKHKLGTTELLVSEAGFGVLALGENHGALSEEEGAELLLYGLKRGIDFFDTAQYYNEYPLIRRFLDLAGDAGYERKDIVICSKSLASDYDGMTDAVDEALREMRLEYIDIFLMHEVRTGQIEERFGAWAALKDAKASGKVKAIGMSTHHVDTAEACAGMTECDCVFALLNIEGMGIRKYEEGGSGTDLPGYWLPDRAGTREEMEEALKLCESAGKGVFTMKALGGGNLISGYREALDYAFSRPFTDCVMLGMSRKQEVDDLLDYLGGTQAADYTPDASMKTLKVNHEDCVGCGSCMKACSSGAISYGEDGLAVIDKNKCIDCGYCAYACPVRAIIRV